MPTYLEERLKMANKLIEIFSPKLLHFNITNKNSNDLFFNINFLIDNILINASILCKTEIGIDNFSFVHMCVNMQDNRMEEIIKTIEILDNNNADHIKKGIDDCMGIYDSNFESIVLDFDNEYEVQKILLSGNHNNIKQYKWNVSILGNRYNSLNKKDTKDFIMLSYLAFISKNTINGILIDELAEQTDTDKIIQQLAVYKTVDINELKKLIEMEII